LALQNKFPKILIIGQYFDKITGSGITMTNLFYGWDRKNIAVAAAEIKNPDYTICENYYNIGNLEIIRDFPFNLNFFEKGSKSGVLLKKNAQKEASNLPKHKISKLENIKNKFLLITGQIHRRRRFIISNEFLNWINEFSPDIIYSQLSSYELICFINRIYKKIHKPIALHIMDDWPVTITSNQRGLFKFYWSKRINNEFHGLIEKAEILLSISEFMSDEYNIRYGKKFLPFHNPIDIKLWHSKPKHDYSVNGNFKLLYAGRIGTGLQNSLLDIANAIKDLVDLGLKIEFQIQATNYSPILKLLVKYEFVKLQDTVPYDQLPGVFSSVDLLLLPNDFDKRSISFLKYSMPTKASEYMISGTPILIYSSLNSAISRHALKYKWAFVITEESKEKIKVSINELYHNIELREKLALRAIEFAKNNYDSNKVREKFKNAFLNQSCYD
jgi:glycosyltransferase involved in cell wall biosynthesis